MAENVRLVGPRQRAHARALIDAAPDGSVMKLGAESRRDAQNRKLHAMIADLREQVPGHGQFSVEQTKLRLMDALGAEVAYLPKLEGEGFFPVGARTSLLTVKQFAALIELVDMEGARHGVQWSEPGDSYFD
jgi:hypothetical protein